MFFVRAENLKRLATRRCGEAIREHRIKRGYSQAYMAERLGVEEASYNRSENTGAGLDSVFRLYMLAQILDIDFLELVGSEYHQPDEIAQERQDLFDTIFHSLTRLKNLR